MDTALQLGTPDWRDNWERPVVPSMNKAGFFILPTMNKPAAIHAAEEFTRNRLFQIRELKEEIAFIEADIAAYTGEEDIESKHDRAVYARIHSRLQEELTVLQQGLKIGTE